MLAEELFEDPAFKAAYHKANSMRLQRTKDGATQESRIHELAGAPLRLLITSTWLGTDVRLVDQTALSQSAVQ